MDGLFTSLSKSGKFILTAVDLLLIAAAAFFTSQIIITAFVHPGAGPAVRTGTVVPPSSPAGQGHEDADSAAVLDRNLFGSRIVGAAPAGNRAAEIQDGLPESALPLELLGTVVNVRGGRSFAIIQNSSTREQQLYFAGDPVVDGVTLLSVGRNRVVLLRDGRHEVLEKAEERAAAPPLRRPGARAVRSVRKQATGGITVRKVGDNSYVMDRREVDGVLQDFSKLLTQIRLVPHFSNGKPDGFKVFNIRPNSLFMKLGMVNGDIIKRVNGLEISGPEQALQMFQQLKDENRITLVIERFRKNLTLQYDIR